MCVCVCTLRISAKVSASRSLSLREKCAPLSLLDVHLPSRVVSVDLFQSLLGAGVGCTCTCVGGTDTRDTLTSTYALLPSVPFNDSIRCFAYGLKKKLLKTRATLEVKISEITHILVRL